MKKHLLSFVSSVCALLFASSAWAATPVAVWTDFTDLSTDNPLKSNGYSLTMGGGSVENGVYIAGGAGLTISPALNSLSILVECELPEEQSGALISVRLGNDTDAVSSYWNATDKKLQQWWRTAQYSTGTSEAYTTNPQKVLLTYGKASGTQTFADGTEAVADQSGLTSSNTNVSKLLIGARPNSATPLTGAKIKAIYLYNSRLTEWPAGVDATVATAAPTGTEVAYSAIEWTNFTAGATKVATLTLADGATLTIDASPTDIEFLRVNCAGDCIIKVSADATLGSIATLDTAGVTGTVTGEYLGSYTGAITSNWKYTGADNALTGATVANTAIAGSGTLAGDFHINTTGAKLTMGGNYTANGNAFIGATNGEVEIAEGANISVPHLRFLNSENTANNVTLNVNGTLTVTTECSSPYGDNGHKAYRGILFGHWQGTGTYNINAGGKLIGEDSYLQIVYSATDAQTLNVKGGELKVRAISSGDANETITLSDGGKISLAEGVRSNTIVQSYGHGTLAAYQREGATTGGWTSAGAIAFTDATNGTTIDPNGLTINLTGALSGEGKIIVNDQSEAKNGNVTLSNLEAHTGAIELVAGNLKLTEEQVAARSVTMTGGALEITISDASFGLGKTFENFTVTGGTVAYKHGDTIITPEAGAENVFPAQTPAWHIKPNVTPNWTDATQWTKLTDGAIPTSGNIAIDFSSLTAPATIEIPAGTDFDNILFVGAPIDDVEEIEEGAAKCELTVALADGAVVDSVTIAGAVTMPLAVVNACTGTVVVDEGYTLSVDVATVGEDEDTPALTKVISGLGAWAKVGEGALALNAVPTVRGGTVVATGTLQFGTAVIGGAGNGVNYNGANAGSQDVRVKTGATLDMNGKPDSWMRTVTLEEGATFANDSTDGHGTNKRQLQKIVLEGNATVRANARFCLNAGGNGDTWLTLNGYTLTKTGDAIFDINNAEVSAGTIQIDAGTIEASNTLNLTGTVAKTGVGLLQIVTASSGGTLAVNGGEVRVTAGEQATKYVVATEGTLTTAGTFAMTADNVSQGTITVESGTLTMTATENPGGGDTGLGGTLNIKAGATFVNARTADALSHTGSPTVNVWGTLDLASTRWTIYNNGVTLNFYGGSTVTGLGQPNGDNYYGALDWDLSHHDTMPAVVNILPNEDDATKTEVTVSANLRMRDAQGGVMFNVAEGLTLNLSGVKAPSDKQEFFKLLFAGKGKTVLSGTNNGTAGVDIAEDAVVQIVDTAALGSGKVSGAGNLILETPAALGFLAETWTGKTTFAPTADASEVLSLNVAPNTTLELVGNTDNSMVLKEGSTVAVSAKAKLEINKGVVFSGISGEGDVIVTGSSTIAFGTSDSNSLTAATEVKSGAVLTIRNWRSNHTISLPQLVVNGEIKNDTTSYDGYTPAAVTLAVAPTTTLAGSGTIALPTTFADGATLDKTVATFPTFTGNVTLGNTLTVKVGEITDAAILTTTGTMTGTPTGTILVNGEDKTADHLLEVKDNALYIVAKETAATVKTAADLKAALEKPYMKTVTVDGEGFTIDSAMTLANGQTLIIPEGVTVTATKDATLIIAGTIEVYGTLNGYALPYGNTGLVPSQGGVVKIGATGTVVMPKAWEVGTVDPATSDVVANDCAVGATIIIGDNEVWKCTGADAWTRQVAKIVVEETTTFYATLADAVAQGGEVTVLADCAGEGIIISKAVTIDFNKHTYTVNNSTLAGSTGTKTICFQILKEAGDVTLKNGTIVGDYYVENEVEGNKSVKRLIQNYANLTLDGMTLDATAGANKIADYACTFAAGTVTLTGGTTITAPTNGYAFDVYYWGAQYTKGVSVTLNDATINGKVEVATDGATLADGAAFGLTLTKGTITGDLVMGNGADKATVSKTADATVGTPDGYQWNTDTGMLEPIPTVPEVDFTDSTTTTLPLDGTFDSSEAALDAAKALDYTLADENLSKDYFTWSVTAGEGGAYTATLVLNPEAVKPVIANDGTGMTLDGTTVTLKVESPKKGLWYGYAKGTTLDGMNIDAATFKQATAEGVTLGGVSLEGAPTTGFFKIVVLPYNPNATK